jgi:hypothetical protein
MIHLRPAMRAKLYLTMCDALEVTDTSNSPEEAQRLALAQLVADYTGDDGKFALHEAFRLADALDYYLTEHCDGPEFGFSLANVSRLVGGDRDVAKAALRLLGARPTYRLEGPDDWATASGSQCMSIRFPRDVLVDRLRCELEEAEQCVT